MSKSKPRFKAGDRVVWMRQPPGYSHGVRIGCGATVSDPAYSTSMGKTWLCVKWDRADPRRSCQGDGGYSEECFDLVEEKIVVKETEKKFDPTKPVQTRDGRKARIICSDKRGTHPIVALVTQRSSHGDEIETTLGYKGSGVFADGSMCQTDLVNIPVKIERWVNIYTGDVGLEFAGAFCLTEDQARSLIQLPNNYITTLKIEWEV